MPACWPKEDDILYVHMRNIKYSYLKVWNFGSDGPMKQLIKLKWPNQNTHTHIITQITSYC